MLPGIIGYCDMHGYCEHDLSVDRVDNTWHKCS